jgi:hypothetical protein
MSGAWGAGNKLTATLSAVEAAEQAAKRAEDARMALYQAARTAFVAKYKMTPEAYIAAARAPVLQAAALSPASRSVAGLAHTNNLSPSSSPSAKVVEYHDKEDAGKLAAQSGRLQDAINLYDAAYDLRVAYEVETGKPPDASHQAAKTMLRARRNSLSGVIAASDNNAGVLAAKAAVKLFFQQQKSPYIPACAV